MLGSVGLTVSWYNFSGTGRIGSPPLHSKIIAAPPSAVKIGAPSTTAMPSNPSAGQRNAAGSIGAQIPTASTPVASATDPMRPLHFGAACQINRNATAANPTTSSDCTTHRGIPYAKTRASRCCDTTNCQLARHSPADIAAPTPCETTRATSATDPRIHCAAPAKASNRFSRAARAPPSIPTTSTRCCTTETEDGIPPRKKNLSTTSETGSSTIRANARETTTSSPTCSGRIQWIFRTD